MSDIVENVVIKGDVSDIIAKLDQMEKKFVSSYKEGTKAAKEASDNQVAAYFKAEVAALSFAGAMGFAKKTIVDSIKASLEEEKALTLQKVAIESMLPGMGKYADLLKRQADEQKIRTGIDDDAIRTLQNMALTYGKSISQIESYTKASIILSNATGGRVGLSEAMSALVKTEEQGSLNRSLIGIPALEKLTKAQLAAGDSVKVLTEQYKDLETIGAKGAAGAVNEFANAWGDVEKSLGGVFTKNELLIGSLREVSKVLNTLANDGPLRALASLGDNKYVMGALAVNPLTAGIAGGIGLTRGALGAYDYGKKAFGSVGEMTPGLGGVTSARTEKEQLAYDEANMPAPPPMLPTAEAFGGLKYSKAYLAQKKEWERRSDFGISSLSGGMERLEEQAKYIEARDRIVLDMADKKEKSLTEIAQTNQERRDQIAEKEFIATQQREQEKAEVVTRFAQMSANIGISLMEELAQGNEMSAKKILASTLMMIGKTLVAEGTKNIMLGTARGFASYGFDPTATGMIAQGSAMVAAGLGMEAGSAVMARSSAPSQSQKWAEQKETASAKKEWELQNGYTSATSTGSSQYRTGGDSRTVTIQVNGNLSPAETGAWADKAIKQAAKEGLIT